MSGVFSLKAGVWYRIITILYQTKYIIVNDVSNKEKKPQHLRKFLCTKENTESEKEGKKEKWLLLLQY